MGSQSLWYQTTLYRSLFGAAAFASAAGTTLLGADLVPRYYGGPARVALRMDEAAPPVNLQETVLPPAPEVLASPPAPVPVLPPVPVPAPPVIAPPAPVIPPPMVPPPPPTVAPPVVQVPVQVVVAPSVDPAQLAHLEAEIDKIKADMKKTVKAPDTKKGWSTPKVAGRVFFDSVNYASQDVESVTRNGNLNNALGVSDARIAVSGTGYDTFDYKLELGIGSFAGDANGQIMMRDIYFGVKKLPILNNVRIGNFRPETTMAYSISPLVLPTLNYTNPSNAFAHGRRLGITSTHFACDQKMRLLIGVFQGGDIATVRTIVNDDQSTLFVTRFTATPIYAQEGKYFFHIGGNYSHHSPAAGGGSSVNVYQANLNTQGTVTTTPSSVMVGTGNIADGSVHQGALEFIAQYKSLGAAGEVYVRNVSPYGGTRRVWRTATGAWIEGRWVITGESREYDKDNGVIGALKPKNNFHALKCRDWNLVDGIGAIELVAQWNYADLTDWRDWNSDLKPVTAKPGQLNELTLATHWLWSQNVRWITQYTRSWQDLCAANRVATTDMIGCGLHVNW